MPMKNPPHPGGFVLRQCIEPMGLTITEPQIRAATVLVFRDHHSEGIQNYAVVGETLWVFTEQCARKIPVAELNGPDATKANEARDIDFRLPAP